MNLEKLILPQGDKILVLPKVDAGKTASGIVTKVNPTSGKKPQQGEVLAISEYLATVWRNALGEGVEMIPGFTSPENKTNGVVPGDQVVFTEYAGDNIEVKDLDTDEMVLVKILPIELVLGIIVDNEIIPPPPETHAS